eukprot:TRINITY_DN2559_c0_g1_i26.p1 TRINITY_DN2559_c0_g1~~TRINITY_DN2559_c0_g1_i26.p1  ORF type:complete len:301 (+),score=55.80 TRINITY_DN2559_c0_g1_i26:476-1378(+)
MKISKFASNEFDLNYFARITNPRMIRRKTLDDILKTVFSLNPELNYYQGYHDITSILLVLFGRNLGFFMSEHIAKKFFRDYLVHPFEFTVLKQLKMIFEIIKREDEDLFQYFQDFDFPIFSLSWVLTWFAHSFSDYQKILRIYDYLICSHASSSTYLATAIILHLKDDMMGRTDGDYGAIHAYFQDLNTKEINFDEVFDLTEKLEAKYFFKDFVGEIKFTFPQDSLLYAQRLDEKLLKYPVAWMEKPKDKGGKKSMKDKLTETGKGFLQVGVVVILFALNYAPQARTQPEILHIHIHINM